MLVCVYLCVGCRSQGLLHNLKKGTGWTKANHLRLYWTFIHSTIIINVKRKNTSKNNSTIAHKQAVGQSIQIQSPAKWPTLSKKSCQEGFIQEEDPPREPRTKSPHLPMSQTQCWPDPLWRVMSVDTGPMTVRQTPSSMTQETKEMRTIEKRRRR